MNICESLKLNLAT